MVLVIKIMKKREFSKYTRTYPRSKIDEISKYTYGGHFGYCYNNKKHGFSTYVLIKTDYPKPCRRKIPFKGTPKFSSWGSYSSIRQIIKLNFTQKFFPFQSSPTYITSIGIYLHYIIRPIRRINIIVIIITIIYVCLSSIYV